MAMWFRRSNHLIVSASSSVSCLDRSSNQNVCLPKRHFLNSKRSFRELKMQKLQLDKLFGSNRLSRPFKVISKITLQLDWEYCKMKMEYEKENGIKVWLFVMWTSWHINHIFHTSVSLNKQHCLFNFTLKLTLPTKSSSCAFDAKCCGVFNLRKVFFSNQVAGDVHFLREWRNISISNFLFVFSKLKNDNWHFIRDIYGIMWIKPESHSQSVIFPTMSTFSD